jgi:hypothetical protein
MALPWTELIFVPRGSYQRGMAPALDDLLEGLVTATVVARLAGVVAFLTWSYLAARHAYALARPGLTVTPPGFVGWYFVPFANLWMPYRAMRQLAMACDPEGRGTAPSIVLVWWLLFLTSNVAPALAPLVDVEPSRAAIAMALPPMALRLGALVALYAVMRFVARGQAFWAGEAAVAESAGGTAAGA